MKPPNYKTKEYFIIKENRPATKRIKQIVDAEYKNNNYKFKLFEGQT